MSETGKKRKIRGEELSEMDIKRGDRMPGEPEYFFFDLKNFTKTEAELEGDTEKWLYLLRNSGTLESFPESIEGESFRVFETASRVAAFNEKEFDEYVSAMMTQRDYNSAMKFAREQGLEQGRAEGKAEGRAERDAFWLGILRENGFTEEQIAEMSKAGTSAISDIHAENHAESSPAGGGTQ